jgi:RNA polymerase sigma-70 factor (ECF subfamily)
VFRVFERNGLGADDARDLTQDVFVAAYRSIGDLRDPAQFPAWLFCIARNTFRNEIERRRARKRFAVHVSRLEAPESGDAVGPEFVADRNADALEQVIRRERADKLITALESLPTQMRRCMHLRVVEECSYEEIAAVMGIAVNTVKAHLHQAKKILSGKLGPLR